MLEVGIVLAVGYFLGMLVTNYFVIAEKEIDWFIILTPNLVWFVFIPEVVREIRRGRSLP